MYSYSGDFNQMGYVEENDEVRGLRILKQYHKAASNYGDYPFNNVQELISAYGKKGPFIAEGLGFNAKVNHLGDSDTKEAMELLAEAGSGQIPEHFLAFNNALGKYASDPGWFKTLTFVGRETAGELQERFADVGKGALTTMKMARFMMPVLVYGGAIYLIWKNAGAISKLVSNAVGRR